LIFQTVGTQEVDLSRENTVPGKLTAQYICIDLKNHPKVTDQLPKSLEFSLIGGANVLPVAGYFFFDWSFTVVGLLFWLEAVTVILFYAGLAMFAKPERQVTDREEMKAAGPIGGQYLSEKPRQPLDAIPSIYTKNLRFVIPSTTLMMLITMAGGGSVTVYGLNTRGGSDGHIGDFFAQFAVFETPAVLAAAIFVTGTQIVLLSRYYFGTGRYQELTAHMCLEVQSLYVSSYFYVLLAAVFYTLATFVIMGLIFEAVLPNVAFWPIWDVVIAGSCLALKLAFERSRFRGERQPGLEDDSFTSNFSPTPPPSENKDSG